MKQNQKYHSCVRESLVMESGRSMVEMLGVLAIIGVLSVAGIADYTTAINKHKTNEVLNGASVRAIMAATQIGRGVPLNQVSLAEFGTDPVKGVSFDSTLVSVGASTDKFGIKASNVEKSICQNLVNAGGNNVKVAKFSAPDQTISASDCEENNVLAFIYNDDLRSFDSGSSGSTGATGATGATGSTGSSGATKCDEGSRRCSSNRDAVETCCGGQWYETQTCPDSDCDSGYCVRSCQENVRECYNGNVRLCNSGAWMDWEQCSNGCENGTCLSGSGSSSGTGWICEEGTKRCCGDYVETCTGAYMGWDRGYCPYGCTNGECNGPDSGSSGFNTGSSGSSSECYYGETRCSGQYVEYCCGGIFQRGDYCSNGCQNGTCIQGAECSDGERRCSSCGNTQTCSSGSWQDEAYCPNGCSCGACISSSGS